MKVVYGFPIAIIFLVLLVLHGCGGDRGGSTPVAVAGDDQNVKTGSLVKLDGSSSYDIDPDPLSYSWSFSAKPVESEAILSGHNAVDPTFIADVDGSYILILTVSDGLLTSEIDSVTITAATANSAPVANAGPNQNVATGSMVTLDGSASSDADSDVLTYNWSFSFLPAGSGAILSDPAAVNPTFTADLDGAYVLTLAVNDGLVASALDIMTITASTSNSAPVANAGPDQNVATGTLVTLDGSVSSDADTDLLTYSWTFSSVPDGSGATLSDPIVVNPTFTADIDGTYVLTLSVNDGLVDSVLDVVTITAATPNSAPVANAGANQNVATGTLVTLDGSASSDADNDILSYSWAFSSLPVGSGAILSDPAAVNPTFTADIDGSYVLKLVVDDGLLSSAIDEVTVTASTANSAPVANAGPNQNVATGSMVTLDGSASSDADSDVLTYNWIFNALPDGSGAILSDAEAVNPTFTADIDGSYVLTLVVDDGLVNSGPDSVTITAATINSAPIADAGPTQNVKTGDLVTLDGSRSSDANNDPLTYSWTVNSVAGVNGVTLTGGDTINPSFIAVDSGSYVFGLVVNDGELDSSPDTVTINAR